MIQRNPFENKRAILSRLVPFGFIKDSTQYRYEISIDAEFLLRVIVSSPYETRISVIDKDVNEEYVPFFFRREENEFFLSLEKKIESILSSIEKECYEKSYIRCPQGDFLLSFFLNRFEDIIGKKKDILFLKRKDTNKEFLSIVYREKDQCYYVLFSGDEGDIDDLYFFSPFFREKKFNIAAKLDGSVPDKTLVSLLMYSRQLNP